MTQNMMSAGRSVVAVAVNGGSGGGGANRMMDGANNIITNRSNKNNNDDNNQMNMMKKRGGGKMNNETENKLQSVIITGDRGRGGGGAVNGKFRTEIYSPASDASPTVEFIGSGGDKSDIFRHILKFMAILCLLYFFVCSLDTLSNSFRLIAGRAAGEVFQQEKLLANPIVGVMIGILVTVAVQSSSTSTSIVVSLVSSGIFKVKTAIPIIMGANIGTSVTNTIVALTHLSNRDEFERAFAGSVLHDMFNLLAVTTLLIFEQLTSYLEWTTTTILNAWDFTSSHKGAEIEVLSKITKPFTSLIVQIDKKVIIGWSLGDSKYDNASLLKTWCNKTTKMYHLNNTTTTTDAIIVNGSNNNISNIYQQDQFMGDEDYGTKCKFIFNYLPLSDVAVGVILLVASLTLLCGCLICLVKVLSTLLKGKLAVAVQKGVNADVPYCPCLTGYLALGIGALMTVLVQSSSVFTSAMTPLIAIGMISLDRAYPLTLGSNLGTTTTAMLAALASEGPNLRWSIQLAMCHFLFNLTGILLFYPIPFTRFPIRMAEALGRVTAKYRWFAIFYLIFSFILLPLIVFALSLIGAIAFYIVLSICGIIFVLAGGVNLLQNYAPERLPPVYRTWNFLPSYLHSLEPYDRLVQKFIVVARQTCRCCVVAGGGGGLASAVAARNNSSNMESREIIKMKQSHSSLGGLDNLGFIRGDQIVDETNTITLKNPKDRDIAEREDVEQTQL